MNTVKKLLALFFSTVLFLCFPREAKGANSCAGSTPQIKEYTLKNGLEVILRPVPQSRNIALVVLYSLGGDHDPAGSSGLGHLLEHLTLTSAAGTAKARSIQDFVSLYPQGWNAQTGDRYTVFATVFPSPRLEAEMADSCSRMRELHVSDQDLRREKPRVAAELNNMFSSIPALAAHNNARELIRPTLNGGRKGGLVEQVNSITLEQVKERLARYYKPKNAVVILAGNFDLEDAPKLIDGCFGNIPPGERAPAPAEPGPSKGKTLKIIQADSTAKIPVACVAYRAPSPGHEAYPAFVLCASLLQTYSWKLEAGQYSVNFAPLDDPEMLAVGAQLKTGESAEEAVGRIKSFVSRVLRVPLRPEDIQLANNMFGFLLGTQELPETALALNCYGLAFSLGRRHQLGIDSKELRNGLTSLSRKELSRAAAEYFVESNSAAAVVR
jgi:zinc protease